MDQTNLHRAVHKYGDMVFKIAMVLLRNRDDAEDAVQNTFLRFYRKAPAFGSSEHERNWLIHVAIKEAKSLRRTALRHSHDTLDGVEVAAPTPDRLPEFLFSLPEKDRLVLQLRYVEGYSAEEIAEVLGCRSAAGRKRLERARAKARDIYEKEYMEHA